MIDNNIGRVPIVENDKLIGMITEGDIAKAMRSFRDVVEGSKQDARIKNLIVEDILKMGAKTIYTNTAINDAAKMMVEEDIGAFPVMNLEDEMVGIITRRNIVNGLA